MRRIAILTLALLLAGAYNAAAQSPTGQNTPATQKIVGPNFVDANGDGICDHFQSGTRPQRMGRGVNGRGGYGPGDGTGNRGIGPRDGTGFGAPTGAGTGTGICDGTGPKGPGHGRGPRR